MFSSEEDPQELNLLTLDTFHVYLVRKCSVCVSIIHLGRRQMTLKTMLEIIPLKSLSFTFTFMRLWPGSIRREWPGSVAVRALDKK